MEELAGINAEELKAVLGMLIEAVKEHVVIDLKEELLGSAAPAAPVDHGVDSTSADKIFAEAFDAYVEESYGEASSENYVNFLKDIIKDDSTEAIDDFADYVCSLLRTVVASGAISVDELPAAEDIEDNVITLFESELNKRISEEDNRYVQLYL